ncbi:IclR family transcriptional regulator [Oleiharenicola lentus]|uniref:IclR family transcriptional regulator n=1 Tax=Oleiharenicola lentus TaxID=2508720 RepID=UPI003F67B2D3
MPAAPDYPVPALEKGLDILEALAAASVPQSLSELATHMKRSSSELFRMLACLEQRGYVAREGVSGKFSLTLKLYALAHIHSTRDKLLQAARPPLEALTEQIRQSCHLSVLERGHLLVIAQQDSPERVRLSIEVGGEFDAAHTASGRLLLSHLSEQERAPWIRTLPKAGKKQFEKKLKEIRNAGFSSAESETVEGVRDIAVLVGNPSAGVMAALAVTRLVRRGEPVSDQVLLRAMLTASTKISESLGLSP